MGTLDGKVALVTGGSRGIGYAIAHSLVCEGAGVMIVGRDVEAASRAAGSLGASTRSAECDVAVPGQLSDAIVATVQAFGDLHIVVNNAGMETHGLLVEQADEDFERQIAVNLNGVYYGIKYGARAIAQSGGGSIVNVSSVAALGGIPMGGAYCAAKAGVLQLTRTAALELRSTGIRVNAVLPGWIKTTAAEEVAGLWERVTGTSYDDLIAAKQGRWGAPDDVAKVVLHLVSEDAAFVTGIAYAVDNGVSAAVV